MSKTIIHYKHWICAAHRLVGNMRGCGRLHGHNYLIEIELTGTPSKEGVIMDFYDIKAKFGRWLDENWDHRLILHEEDPLVRDLEVREALSGDGSLVVVPFIPTAENMANYLLKIFNNRIFFKLYDVNGKVSKVTVHETHKGRAAAVL